MYKSVRCSIASTFLLPLSLVLGGCSGDDTESACVQLDTSGRRIIIRDYQYDRYRYFDVGKFGGVNHLGIGDTIKTFYLYQSIGTLDPNEPEAVAYPNSLEPESSPDSIEQRFRQLDLGYDYEILMDPPAGEFFVFFVSRLQNIQTTTIAYHMVVRKADGSLLTFGSIEEVPLQLQILKRPNPQPADPHWEAEWKNVYDLRRRNIDYQYLDLDIFKGAIGDEDNRENLNHQNGQYYLRLLGLDSVSESGAPLPDGKVDDNPAILDSARGLVIFPSRYPFADSTVLEDHVRTLYSNHNPNDLRDSSKYFLRFNYLVYDLGHQDIVDGSVRVTVNGTQLSSGFSVDRTLGKLWLTHNSAYEEAAEVDVCFEYKD